MNETLILGIETSCDETSASVVKNGREVLSNVIASSAEIQAKYGGVVPEVASRQHIESISQVVDEALATAGVGLKDLSALAVTIGPGLIGALLVGVNYTKGLAFGADLPLVGVHHIAGHIASNYLESEIKPPFVSLVVSGGHTQLIHVKDDHQYEILGSTRDDAIGEAYDKVARLLKLGYPGGPNIDRVAQTGQPNIPFPRALNDGSLDFSYSGLKSAVINYLNSAAMKQTPVVAEDVAASFQQAAIEVLIQKTQLALVQTGVKTLTLAGGVASNSRLRQEIKTLCETMGVKYHIPRPILCTDNGAMIAAAGHHQFLKGNFVGMDVNAYATLKLDI